MTNTSFYVELEKRGLLTLSGADVRSFLQGLITNDIQELTAERAVYACLLSPQGKFLHDFFIYEQGAEILIDCEGGERAADLAKRLNMYKLRSDVTIQTQPENTVFALLTSRHPEQSEGSCDLSDSSPLAQNDIWKDPRHAEMGYRSFVKPEGLPEMPFAEWDKRRIALTIPDGSRDLLVGFSTMDEAHMDQLNAISYDKGCYIGQELTARMHYRGLGKKHLQSVEIDNLPEGAELRSTCENIGIALVRGTNL